MSRSIVLFREDYGDVILLLLNTLCKQLQLVTNLSFNYDFPSVPRSISARDAEIHRKKEPKQKHSLANSQQQTHLNTFPSNKIDNGDILILETSY
jgi:hypothetical protein